MYKMLKKTGAKDNDEKRIRSVNIFTFRLLQRKCCTLFSKITQHSTHPQKATIIMKILTKYNKQNRLTNS